MPAMAGATRQNHEALADGLFFIVGVGRSGTTLLQAMLSCHPRIVIPPETQFFTQLDPIDPRFGGDPLPRERVERYFDALFAQHDWTDAGLPRERLEAALRATNLSARAIFLAWMAAYQEHVVPKPRVGEKSPDHWRRIDRIRQLFPKAKFIHVYRDPRDVAASRLRMPWSGDTARDAARFWFKALRSHERCTATLSPSTYTGLKYEALVEDPERELRRLCAFLGEDYDPAVLAFDRRERTGFLGIEHWKEGTRRPVNAASIGRYRADLSMRQIALIERHTRPLLQRFGYRPVAGWRTYHPVWTALDGADHVRRKSLRSIRKRIARS